MSNRRLGNFLAYVILMLSATLLLISNLLPYLGINITGSFVNVLRLIKDIALLLVVGVGAFSFARGRKIFFILFLVAIAVYVVCAILGLF